MSLPKDNVTLEPQKQIVRLLEHFSFNFNYLPMRMLYSDNLKFDFFSKMQIYKNDLKMFKLSTSIKNVFSFNEDREGNGAKQIFPKLFDSRVLMNLNLKRKYRMDILQIKLLFQQIKPILSYYSNNLQDYSQKIKINKRV